MRWHGDNLILADPTHACHGHYGSGLHLINCLTKCVTCCNMFCIEQPVQPDTCIVSTTYKLARCVLISGSISRNVVRGFQGILVLPQKPYLTDGTLRQQVCVWFCLLLTVLLSKLLLSSKRWFTSLFDMSVVGLSNPDPESFRSDSICCVKPSSNYWLCYTVP